MTALTQAVRTALAVDILKHGFGTRLLEIRARWSKWSYDMYDSFIGADKKEMYALPDGWLPVITEFRCAIAGEVTYVRIGVGTSYAYSTRLRLGLDIPSSVERRILAKNTQKTHVLPAGHPLALAYLELDAEDKDLAKEINEAEAQVMSVLNSARSIEKLVSLWPEVAQFAEVYRKKTSEAGLPAVLFGDLNRILDLPPEASEVGE